MSLWGLKTGFAVKETFVSHEDMRDKETVFVILHRQKIPLIVIITV